MNTFAELHTEDQAESFVRGSEDVLDGDLQEFEGVLEVDSEFGDAARSENVGDEDVGPLLGSHESDSAGGEETRDVLVVECGETSNAVECCELKRHVEESAAEESEGSDRMAETCVRETEEQTEPAAWKECVLEVMRVTRTEECLHVEWTMEPVVTRDPWMGKMISCRGFQHGK